MTYHPEAAPKEAVCPTETDLESLTVPGKGVIIWHPLHINLFWCMMVQSQVKAIVQGPDLTPRYTGNQCRELRQA